MRAILSVGARHAGDWNQIMNTKTLTLCGILTTMLFSSSAIAAAGWKIDEEANKSLVVFQEEISGSKVFLDQAAGYLIFPKVYKVGIGVGAESGEGALRVGGTTVDYYRTTSGSIGFQLGAQAKSIIVVFMTKESLDKFRNASGWKVGVDGSVALIDIGAGKAIDTHNIKDPVVGFVFGSKGLMYNLTLEGSKFSKLDKSESAAEPAAE
jgi:lipid-binding SYLF domain-containing protein